jgi:AraC-like DNA-binding protein
MLKTSYIRFFYSDRAKNEFNLILTLIFALSIVNIFYKINWTGNGFEAALNLWNPSWLLFGPLLFYAYKAHIGKPILFVKKHFFHLIPFLAFTVFFVTAYFSTDMKHPWNNELFTAYQNSYVVIVFSLFLYSCYTIFLVLKSNIPNGAISESLIITLATLYMLICMVLVIIYLAWGVISVDLGFDYRFFSYALLFFGNIAILWYWFFGEYNSHFNDLNEEFLEIEVKSYKNSPLTVDLAEGYKERIVAYFQNPNSYLDTNLSLDSLAKDLNIPKHYLSQLFNIYFEKSFHTYVAEHRIDYAIELLNSNKGRFKIETLSFACGFNSKTSFNKHFKNKTGLTPSDYQLQFNALSA